MDPAVDVLIPTRDRPAALATTLAGLAAQDGVTFRIILSDQSELPLGHAALAMVRALRRQGVPVKTLCNRPPRGIAQQWDFLLGHARAPYVLFLDDDVLLKTGSLRRLHTVISKLGCGMVSYSDVDGCTMFDRAALSSAGSSDAVAERFGSVTVRPADAWSRVQVEH
jgi:hypothetical protein